MVGGSFGTAAESQGGRRGQSVAVDDDLRLRVVGDGAGRDGHDGRLDGGGGGDDGCGGADDDARGALFGVDGDGRGGSAGTYDDGRSRLQGLAADDELGLGVVGDGDAADFENPLHDLGGSSDIRCCRFLGRVRASGIVGCLGGQRIAAAYDEPVGAARSNVEFGIRCRGLSRLVGGLSFGRNFRGPKSAPNDRGIGLERICWSI